jgi:hypothetical protein
VCDLQVLETQAEDEGAIADLGAAADRWLGGLSGDTRERIVGFGPRFFRTSV